MLIELPSLAVDQVALVKEIKGGHVFISKLQSIGIRTDKMIKKVSGQPLKGPQIVKIDNLQIAIGHGMAKHIIVEVK
jgi:Fe2+ transport system protein FeoA